MTNESIFVGKGHVVHHFYKLFYVNFNHVIIPPVLAVTKGSDPLSLLLKQEGGIGPISKTGFLYFRPCYHFNNYMVEISSKNS